MNIIKQFKDFSKIIDSNGIDVLYIMVSLMMLNILYFKSTDEYNYDINTIKCDNKKFYTLYLLLENINSILNILDRDDFAFIENEEIKKLDISQTVKKKRVCLGIAKFYVTFFHLFASSRRDSTSFFDILLSELTLLCLEQTG